MIIIAIEIKRTDIIIICNNLVLSMLLKEKHAPETKKRASQNYP